jgi:CTP:molybdopterin cytidylyltransferase MocA
VTLMRKIVPESVVHRQPAVILAAGHGTRMGGPKVFTELGGITFLERILMRMREASCLVILVVDPLFRTRVEALVAAIGQSAALPAFPLHWVEADGKQPMLATVQAGLGALDSETLNTGSLGAWVWPVDAPLLSAEGWRRARARVNAAPDVILKLRTGGHTGHPTWFPRWACDGIRSQSWEDGLLGFLKTVPAERIAQLELPAEILGDFNTPEQLAAARVSR